ncbi:alpha/beta fold hydrolase [Hydrogenophaga sp. PBL-H3]|uniref:alpha/beta fold hydrolase n=1 Tax=Hydrogenophaga sp. PBL-H3 TaxID=434010 RepID=UPI001320329D|nr:alpha/beta hydrolase [Hydrogenophaga sp. PBL-H3]QHE75338.1 alpha/beta fold hydrolase [Hydrogenophaga sp. PBL-H3]QHE79765.1 alpha/beta fold hydrolase [Hydrogenophaga sp. PBL-H3]
MNITHNGLRIEFESDGDEHAPAVLLTMGLGMQLTAWPTPLVQAIVQAGYRVIRFDNRDIGLSGGLDHLGVPNIAWQAVRSRLGLAVRSPYSVQDMALDAIGLLDALGVQRAHLVGVSMGGMISQRVAATVPGRVLSLTSVMSSSGAPGLPGPRPDVTRALLKRPRSQRPEDVAAHALEMFRLIGSPAFPQDMPAFEQRVLADAVRSYRPHGVSRQLLAVVSDTRRHTVLQGIACPTLVVHGTADPLVPLACGQDTAARIAGARFESIEGMGHDWPPGVAALLAGHIVPHIQAAQTPT